MANENPNPLFAYVESRIAAWQAVLASLKSALSLDPGGKGGDGIDLSSLAVSQNGEVGQPVDLPDGAFFGKSIPACVKLYLSAAKKKKTAKEIATALREGGVESTAGSFESTVSTALVRLRNAGEVLRFANGLWGLSEWVPPNMRANSSGAKPTVKAKKKGKKAKAKAAPPIKPEGTNVTEMSKPEVKPEARIAAFFLVNHREITAKEIATTLGMKIQTVHLILSKLVRQKKIEKLPSGNFRSPGAVAS